LPLDAVTLTACFRTMLLLPQSDHGAEPLAAKFQVSGRRLARLLLERVKHVDGLPERCDVKHSVFAFDMDSDFAYPGPIVGIGFQSFGSKPCCTRRS